MYEYAPTVSASATRTDLEERVRGDSCCIHPIIHLYSVSEYKCGYISCIVVMVGRRRLGMGNEGSQMETVFIKYRRAYKNDNVFIPQNNVYKTGTQRPSVFDRSTFIYGELITVHFALCHVYELSLHMHRP